MKKTIKISLILFSIVCLTMSVYAASCSMSLQTTKNEFSKNDEVVVNVAIDSISDAGEGIIGLEATLEYDKDNLTYEKMEGQNGWDTPSYNEANGSFVMLKNDLTNTPETVLKITFKVKNTKNQKATIALKNIKASGGIDTGDISVANITKTITIKGGASNSNNSNTTTNTDNNGNITINGNTNASNQSQNGSSNVGTSTDGTRNIVANTNNNNMMQNGSLPKAGAGSVIFIVLVGAFGIAIVFYIKMKKIDKDVK